MNHFPEFHPCRKRGKYTLISKRQSVKFYFLIISQLPKWAFFILPWRQRQTTFPSETIHNSFLKSGKNQEGDFSRGLDISFWRWMKNWIESHIRLGLVWNFNKSFQSDSKKILTGPKCTKRGLKIDLKKDPNCRMKMIEDSNLPWK